MNFWNVLPFISAPMPFQMALDEILFRKEDMGNPALEQWLRSLCNVPLLRFFTSSEPWRTVGYSTKLELGKNHVTPSCRRLTGGGIVDHGKDIMFSLTADKTQDESFSSVRLSYLKLHEAVKKGLESIGYKPFFYRCDQNLPKGADCFRFPIATDLGFAGGKVAGGAQKRSMGRFLHQESVQIPECRDERKLSEVLTQAIGEVFNVPIRHRFLVPEVLERTEELAKQKYVNLLDGPEKTEVVESQTVIQETSR